MKMTADKIVVLLLGILFTALTPIKAEEFECPSACHCSTDYIAVKCRGLEKFPVLKFAGTVRSLDLSRGRITDITKEEIKAYDNLQHLDVRNNEIKSVSPGLFSELESLRELYIESNPWSCDESTLQVMQMELTALADRNPHLENFDGGKVECSDPPSMKGKKPLHSINPMTKVHQVQKEVKGHQDNQDETTAGMITISIFGVVLLSVILGVVCMFREKLLCCIKKPKPVTDPESKMEAAELDNKSILIDSKKKRHHKSQGLPASPRTSKSSHNDAGGRKDFRKAREEIRRQLEGQGKLDHGKSLVDSKKKRHGKSKGLPASTRFRLEVDGRLVDSADKFKKGDRMAGNKILIDSMEKRRRMSQGLPASARSSTSSLEDINGGVANSADKVNKDDNLDDNNNFIDSMEKKRRMSQGLPVSAKSSTSSLEEVAKQMVDSADKLESHCILDSKSIMIDSMDKRSCMPQGLRVPVVRSPSNLDKVDRGVVDSPKEYESQDQLHSESTLNNSMMESKHVLQDIQVSNISYASNSDDEMFHSMNKSAGFAEEKSSSSEEGYATPT